MSQFPMMQVSICGFIPLFNMILVKVLKIYKEIKAERIFLFQEFVVFSVYCLIGGFLQDIDDEKKDIIGYVVVAIVIFAIFMGSFLSLASCVWLVYLKLRGRNRKVFNTKVVAVEDGEAEKQDNQLCDENFLEIRNLVWRVPCNSRNHSAMQSFNPEDAVKLGKV